MTHHFQIETKTRYKTQRESQKGETGGRCKCGREWRRSRMAIGVMFEFLHATYVIPFISSSDAFVHSIADMATWLTRGSA